MSAKTAVKYPCVVGTLSKTEKVAFEALKDEEEGEGPIGMFTGLSPEGQEMRHDFWHALYKAHKLNPQRDYTIDPESFEIIQRSGDVDTETV